MRRIIILFMVSLLILYGCKQAVQPQIKPPEKPSTPIEAGKTCSSQGGDICNAGENCPAALLDASDSFSCCTEQCIAREQKSFSSFDFGKENQNMGSVGK